MKLIETTKAVGHVLCHDLTQIIPGVTKDARFRKGHVVQAEDIPVLLSMGKEHLYVWEKTEGVLHEDEAAAILKEIAVGLENPSFEASLPKEGKVELRASKEGLLKVDSDILNQVNALGEMMIATVHGNFPVKMGEKVAATRIIPLVIAKEKMDRAKACAGATPILRILPFQQRKVGIITTGSEVAKGIISDAFGPVVMEKVREYGQQIVGQKIVDDKKEHIVEAMEALVKEGADLLLCTGGMSVDPDDRTPAAIHDFGAEIVSYGAPVLPGAMFLLAYAKRGEQTIPVMGLPGCVMYAKRTVFDLVLPRVLAGEQLTQKDLSSYGEGGLCLGCPVCTFPHCGFGK